MQSDVWRFFEEASSYGREVYTRNGRRGPALAYYTPTLSAIRGAAALRIGQQVCTSVHAQQPVIAVDCTIQASCIVIKKLLPP